MQDEASLDSSSLKAFQNKSHVGCFCMLKKLKGWNLRQIYCFKSSWLLFVVSWIPKKSRMWTNLGCQLPSIFSKGKSVRFSNGLTLWFVDGDWREMGREYKEVGAMATCYCLTFMCCQPCLSNFQCFQSCVSWTPFCIFSCYVSNAVVSGTYPWVAIS